MSRASRGSAGRAAALSIAGLALGWAHAAAAHYDAAVYTACAQVMPQRAEAMLKAAERVPPGGATHMPTTPAAMIAYCTTVAVEAVRVTRTTPDSLTNRRGLERAMERSWPMTAERDGN